MNLDSLNIYFSQIQRHSTSTLLTLSASSKLAILWKRCTGDCVNGDGLIRIQGDGAVKMILTKCGISKQTMGRSMIGMIIFLSGEAEMKMVAEHMSSHI